MGQKIIIIVVIFIIGLHKKPQGCGASVAPAAGPFTIKNGRGVALPTHPNLAPRLKKESPTSVPLLGLSDVF
jgi:hypothetical protein